MEKLKSTDQVSDPDSNQVAPDRRYVLITPCRDEAEYLPITIRAVAAQTTPPARWVIVDDGSTDDTPQILADAAAQYDWIRIVRCADRGERKVGAGVIEAFYVGLETVDLDNYDYLCKLDGDLEIPPRYFELLMEEMEHDPRLGNVSGKVYFLGHRGSLINEGHGEENAVGPTKFYRVQCFYDIGGFQKRPGWATIDGHLCRLNGWIAKSIERDDLRVIHFRQMGSSQNGVYGGRLRGGSEKWQIGNSLPYVMATCVYRLTFRPYILGALCTLVGYLSAMVRREARYGDRQYRRYLRQLEMESILLGKRRAIARWNKKIRFGTSRAS